MQSYDHEDQLSILFQSFCLQHTDIFLWHKLKDENPFLVVSIFDSNHCLTSLFDNYHKKLHQH